MKKQIDAIYRLMNYIQIEGDVADVFVVKKNNKPPFDIETKQSRNFQALVRVARKSLRIIEKEVLKDASKKP